MILVLKTAPKGQSEIGAEASKFPSRYEAVANRVDRGRSENRPTSFVPFYVLVHSICDKAARMPRRGFRGGSQMLETRTGGVSCLSSPHCATVTWEQKRNSRCNFADNGGFNCLPAVEKERHEEEPRWNARFCGTPFENDNMRATFECLFLSRSLVLISSQKRRRI